MVFTDVSMLENGTGVRYMYSSIRIRIQIPLGSKLSMLVVMNNGSDKGYSFLLLLVLHQVKTRL